MLKGRWHSSAMVLGFALGGFFDGILRHQILQWRHLLSLVPEVSSLRVQVLWDGYFHALMYLLAAVSLWALWAARAAPGERRGLPTWTPFSSDFGSGMWSIACSLTRRSASTGSSSTVPTR